MAKNFVPGLEGIGTESKVKDQGSFGRSKCFFLC